MAMSWSRVGLLLVLAAIIPACGGNSSGGGAIVSNPRLVRDLSTAYGTSSNPAELTAVGETLFFVADDGFNGPELWKTDGSETGTVLVLSLIHISEPTRLLSISYA